MKQKYKTLLKSKRGKELLSVGVLTAISLGSFQTVYANEVTENQATNLPNKQEISSSESLSSQNATGNKSGKLSIEVSKSELDRAIEKSKELGLTINKNTDIDKGIVTSTEEANKKIIEIKNDYKNQIDEINLKNKNYENKITEYRTKNAEILKENEEKKKVHAVEVEKINKKNEEIKKENALIEKENTTKLKEYNESLKNENSTKKQIDKIVGEKPLVESEAGLSMYGKYDRNSEGSKQYFDFVLINDKSKTAADTLERPIEYTDKSTITNVMNMKHNPNAIDRYTKLSDNKADLFYDFKDGGTFTVTNVATFNNGEKLDLKFTLNEIPKRAFKESSMGVYREKLNKSYGLADDNDDLYKPTFSLQKADDKSLKFYFNNLYSIDFKIEFLSKGKPVKLAMPTLITDVDWRQGAKLTFNEYTTNNELISRRSGLSKVGNHQIKGYPVGVSDDNSELPTGAYLTYGYGTSINYRHSTAWEMNNEDVSGRSIVDEDSITPGNGIQFNLFGEVGYMASLSTPTPPEVKPTKPLLPLPTLEIREVPTAPDKPTVNYHYNRLSMQPSVLKEVKNNDNLSINNHAVPKDSIVKWELHTTPLFPDRKAVTSYDFTDALPPGFELDLEATKKASQDYDIEFNREKNIVIAHAKTATLEKINHDLSKEYNVSSPVLVGKIKNDGAIYKNNFSLNVNNEYTVHSNTVTITTPGDKTNLIRPEKHNYNDDKVLIDGKLVSRNTVNHYELTWDLDQYKGVVASKEEIKKGFYYIEDYPEEALNINEDGIKITTETGEIVSGVTTNVYENVGSVPEEVKRILANSKITPNGKFVVFKVTNPEEFYNKYVVNGKNLKIKFPTKINSTLLEGSSYINKGYQIDFGNGYYTNTVTNNIPKNPKPEKHNINEKGIVIDGKNVGIGEKHLYKITWDFSTYKDVTVSKNAIQNGFYHIDDLPEKGLDFQKDKFKVVDEKGTEIKNISVNTYENLEKAPEKIREIAKSNNLVLNNKFVVFSAENPEEFFNSYVKKGVKLNILLPSIVNNDFKLNGGEYRNQTMQIDFNKVNVSNVVSNFVPNISVKKDVTSTKDGESVDKKEIALNNTFYYHLSGGLIPKNRSEELKKYEFVDDYDESKDQYIGYSTRISTDIKLKDGTTIKVGTDVTNYTTELKESGKVRISFKEEFLEKILDTSDFKADVILEMKRIKEGTVENMYTNPINHSDYISNTVVTNTPEPKPEPKPELPRTGTVPLFKPIMGAIISLVLGIKSLRKRK